MYISPCFGEKKKIITPPDVTNIDITIVLFYFTLSNNNSFDYSITFSIVYLWSKLQIQCTVIVLTNTTGTCHAMTMDYYVLL